MTYKATTLILSIFIFLGCYTTNQISAEEENKIEEKVVVTNIINKIDILGIGTLKNKAGDVSVKVKPIDTRLFDLNTILNTYVGGEHSYVITLVDDIQLENLEATQNEYEGLTDILLQEGLSSSDVLKITEIIDEDLDASGGTYVYTDSNIQFESNVGVSDSNPFGREGRYQTVVEFEIKNESGQPHSVCEEDFLIVSGQSSYTNISTNQLLSELSASSLQYELLHKELLKDCEIIPESSTLTTHLVFPSFYEHTELVMYWEDGNTLIEDDFRIERNILTNRYYFSKIKVKGSNTQGFRILGNTTTMDESKYSSADTNNYNFIRIGNSLRYVGFEEFFIHDEIDLNTIELFTVRQNDDESFEILKSPITRNNIKNGTVAIEN